MKKILLCLVSICLLLTACGAPEAGDRSADSGASTASSESESSRRESQKESKPVLSIPPESSTETSVSSESSSEPSSGASEPDVSASSDPSASEDDASEEESVPEADSVASRPDPSESSESRTPGLMTPPDAGQANGGGASDSDSSSTAASFVSGSGTSDEIDVFDRINRVRENLGLGKLSYNSSLQSAARVRAQEFALYDLESHVRPDGRAWYTVLQSDVPVSYRTAGENVAGLRTNRADVTGVTPAEWVDMWVGSADHYATMTDSGFTHMGVGIYTDHDADGTLRTYAVTLFASF